MANMHLVEESITTMVVRKTIINLQPFSESLAVI
jgi:hypothetical protein